MSSVSGTKRRLEVKDAKRFLKDAYLKNPNPSAAQLSRIAEDIGRSAESVSKWFDKEQRSSQVTTPEPTSHSNRSQERSAHEAAASATNGSGLVKPPVRSGAVGQTIRGSALKPKSSPLATKPDPPKQRSVPQPTQPQTQPTQPQTQPTQARPEVRQEIAPPPAASKVSPSQVVIPQEAVTETIAPLATPSQSKGKAREEPEPIGQDIEIVQHLSDTEEQTATEDEQQRGPALNIDNFPAAFEGVTKLEHELHCAMLLYYQATQGLPMTPPGSLPLK